ncbi:MAG: peptidylprolyl isomerase [Nitrospirae bacterium]|nr:peptidylprolyl isomerase [Nitrospirota bacterium]
MRLGVLFGVIVAGFIGGAAFADELASVNGKAVTAEEFIKKLGELPPSMKDSINTPEGRREILDILIAREILYQEAVKRQMEKEKEVQAKMAEARRTVLVEAMMDRLMAQKSSGPALKNYYSSHRNEFREVRASHILAENEEEARNLKQQLSAGADFAELARRASRDTRSGPAGGDLGYFTKGRMVPEIAAVAFAMRVNQISDPVRTSYGYHLVKVTDAREAKSFEDLPPPILDDVKRAVLQEEIKTLRAANKVTVNMEKLKQLR